MTHTWISEDGDFSACLACGAHYAEDRRSAEHLRCSGRTDLCHGDPHEAGYPDSVSATEVVGCDCDLCRG